MASISPAGQTRDLALEGARAAFVDDRTVFVVLKDGTVYPIEIIADGKTVSKLTMGSALAQTTIPAIIKRVSEEHLFIGSTVGPSVLLKTAHIEEEVDSSADSELTPMAVVDTDGGMDLYDDDDIYGDLDEPSHINGSANGAGPAKNKRTVVHLSLCDSLPGYGPIADMTFSLAKNGDRPVPELVAATGSGLLGGFTLFQRDLPVRTKRKLHAIGGARGMWSLPIRQPVKVNGVAYERAVNPHQLENDSVIVSTDTNPSPGLSRIASKTSKGDINITTRIPGTTIGAAPFFQRTAILHVVTNAICVLAPDGSPKQKIQDLDGNMPRPKIKACNICDPYVLVFREDDSIGLFIDNDRGKIRRKDMSPMGDKSSCYIAGCFYTDTSGIFETHVNPSSAAAVDTNITSTLQATVNSDKRSQWLILVRPQGVMEIWSLPKLTLVYSIASIAMSSWIQRIHPRCRHLRNPHENH
jgi:cleavage and polyadenylation specificity factor subunit 1